MGVSTSGGTPIAGWFIVENGGNPISGNLHVKLDSLTDLWCGQTIRARNEPMLQSFSRICCMGSCVRGFKRKTSWQVDWIPPKKTPLPQIYEYIYILGKSWEYYRLTLESSHPEVHM